MKFDSIIVILLEGDACDHIGKSVILPPLPQQRSCRGERSPPTTCSGAECMAAPPSAAFEAAVAINYIFVSNACNLHIHEKALFANNMHAITFHEKLQLSNEKSRHANSEQ